MMPQKRRATAIVKAEPTTPGKSEPVKAKKVEDETEPEKAEVEVRGT